jgi:outer membrane receptor protein involved in Fe transport
MMRRTVFAVLIVLIVATGAQAQTMATSTVTGKVTAEGAPLPGVRVTATSERLQGPRSTVTDANGAYLLPFLPPGAYTVTFEMAQMQTHEEILTLSGDMTDTVNVELQLAAVTGEIVVTAEKAMTAPIEATAVTANFKQELIDVLPTSRSYEAITLLAPGVNAGGPNDNIIISGAMSYDSLYLVNGMIVNENLRGQPHDLYIEDAIEETTVQTGAISAEFGHFTGGVVNALTKSGGNRFSGSLRATLRNESWTEPTEFTLEQEDKINPRYEATLGGPVLRDRLWFFLAGRYADTSAVGQTNPGYARTGDQDAAGNWIESGEPLTPITYPTTNEETRMEVKLTWGITQSHRVIGSYIDIDESATNTTFGDVMDLRSLIPDRTYPNTLAALNYNGVITDNFFVEAQYSQKEYTFLGGGSRWVDDPALGQYDGTMVRDRQRSSRRYWSPTFRYQEGGESRDHELWTLNGSYFLSTGSTGTHELKAGYEYFNEIRDVNNWQNGSDYRVFAYTTIHRGDQIYPRFRSSGSSTRIYWYPIFVESSGSNYASHAVYLNDRWVLNNHWTFNLGVRYDKNDAVSGDGSFQIDDSDVWSPRLAANFDVFANGKLKLIASYGQYTGRLAEGVGNDGDPAGRNASFGWNYAGPAVNDDPTVPTSELIPTDEALAILFDWFFANGGTDLRPLRTSPSIPGFSRILDPNGLTSPNVKEWTLGVGATLGTRGVVRADVVYRNWDDFYAGFTNMETGQVEFEDRTFDLSIVGNTNVYDREYIGLHSQIQYRFTDRFNLGLNYTLSKQEGNVNGETWNSGPVRGTANEYPEYRDESWNYPTGPLTGDRRHRVKLWLTYDLTTGIGDFLFSLLQSFESGTRSSTDGTIDTRSFVDNPGYQSPTSGVGYFFHGRGDLKTDDITRTDISINYTLPIKSLDLFLKFDIFNIFNEQAVVSFDETVLTEDDEDYLALFNPWTETPIECPQGAAPEVCEGMGAHWQKGENFGQPEEESDFQRPRTFVFSFGLRF